MSILQPGNSMSPVAVFTLAAAVACAPPLPLDAIRTQAVNALFDFEEAGAVPWQVVNDGVMGGRSRGFVTIEGGVLSFTGELVTRGGGFTSVRFDRAFDLEGYDGLELRVRGGGRTFEVDLSDGTRRWGRGVSRRAPFPTQEEWTAVRVPFEALRASIFGEPVDAPPVDLSKIRRISLFILDGIDGPFRLEVDSIRAYRISGDWAAAPGPTDCLS